MDQLSGISNVMNSMPFVTGVMEPITVQSPSSAIDCVANAGYELVQNMPMEISLIQSTGKATVLPAGITVRAANPANSQLQQQKLLWQQQQQLIRQQQMLQQQYVQQQLLQNALLQAMQQVQCQTTTSNRPFTSSPVIVSPSGVPASSAGYVTIQMSSNDQMLQSRPLSMASTTVAVPITSATAVQPQSLVQLGGVRMVPVAPFVANQMRSSQPASVMSVSRPQQPIVQRPFIIGQSGLVSVGTPLSQSVVMSTSIAGASTAQRPVLVSPTPHIPLTATMTMIHGGQSYPIAQLAQVQQQSTRFISSQTTAPQQVAYVSPVLPSLVTFGDNATASSGAFQIPADMSSVLTDTLKLSASLSPSLVGSQLINPPPSLSGFEATAPIHELSLTADGRLVSIVGKPMQQQAYVQSITASASRSEPMPVVPHDMANAAIVLPSATVMPTCTNIATVPSQPSVLPTVILPAAVVAPSTTAVSHPTTTKPNTNVISDSLRPSSVEKPITVLSSEPDRPDSCILTHIIEGFVIREGPVPFPVHKSFLNELPVSEDDDTDNTGDGHSSDLDSSDQDDAAPNSLPTPKSDQVTISENPCEFCGKTGFEVRFGRPHRFCSLSCSSKQHVALTKPGIRHLSSEKADSSAARRMSNNMESGSSSMELMQGVEEVTVERESRSTVQPSVDERDQYPGIRQPVNEREHCSNIRHASDEREREHISSNLQSFDDRDPCPSTRHSIEDRERYHSNRQSVEEREFYPPSRLSMDEREPCSSIRQSIEDREHSSSNRLSIEEREHYASIRQSFDDRDRFSSHRQPVDFLPTQPIVQRSPGFRHDSPNKSFQSPPHQSSALAARGPSDLHLSEWGVQEVYDFVRSLPGCSIYADEFRRQEIDGQALMLLTEDHMMTTLNMKLGPALKICQHIRALRDL